MTLKVGTYHFSRHRSSWTIYICDYSKDGFSSSSKVKEVATYEEAVRETYRLNGWGEPKRIVKKY